MKTKDLVKRVGIAVAEYVGSKVEVTHFTEYWSISYEVRTTTTRASSLVTRIRLLVEEIVRPQPIVVDKVLLSDSPKERSTLATWMIFVKLSTKKGKRKEKHELRTSVR